MVRKSNRNTAIQLIVSEQKGDRTLLTVSSKELGKYGYNHHTANLPAAYLTGLLFGKRMISKGYEEAIMDIGLHASTKGGRIYSALKGVVDAGVHVPHNPEILPDEERIRGDNIKAFTGVDVVAQFEAARENILR